MLMGEFERSGAGLRNGLTWAIKDILTVQNFAIGITAGLVGHVFLDLLRNRLWKNSN